MGAQLPKYDGYPHTVIDYDVDASHDERNRH